MSGIEGDQTLGNLDYSRDDADGDEAPNPALHLANSDPDWGTQPRKSPLQILQEKKDAGDYLKICAPMVRYSKLPFRELVRGYNVDVAYTPMILADVYKHSKISRDTEYRTNSRDQPVVVQFAAHTAEDLADAAELAAPYANGIDLNCGCPQKWAIHEGIGAFLMEKPELVRDMVRQVKARTSPLKMADGSTFPCSIKIRVHPDLRQTVEFVKRAEAVGVDWITVHGRTRRMKNTEPVDLDAIKLVKETATVPIFANGSIFSLSDADRTVQYTGVDGVMAARGLLENPALFAGHTSTPMECVEKYVRLGIEYGSTSFIFHHHLMFMLESSMSRAEKKRFNCLTSIPGIVDFLEEHYGLDIVGRPLL
ncbi:tRNA-dihydrouridine(20a/20b) synthase [NAD(P)+]-like protein [Rhizophlyctis rosea]|nr:tRNA-dihydrouridine(20a/20b) synthase [NAD(P)+]-like protein [Rhizophlyctis rosea]